MLGRQRSLFAITLLINSTPLFTSLCNAFSSDPLKKQDSIAGLSRRELLSVPFAVGGAVVYGKILSDAAKKFTRGDLAYPDGHENRVKSTIETAVMASIAYTHNNSNNDGMKAPRRALRVLEVGIGKDCRIIRRGLYEGAISQAISRGVTKIEFTGVDIVSPATGAIQRANEILSRKIENNGVDVSFEYVEGSVTSRLNFEDGFFDCVICSLTLCSVDNQIAALNEIKRVLKPKTGSFGYIEHVAVNDDEPYRLLEIQQLAFDGLQQTIADNCHLHRFTEDNIYTVFGVSDGTSQALSRERFLVDGMWPVSCQTCGVIKLA